MYRDIPDTQILRMLVCCGSQAIVAPVSIKFAPVQRWYIYLSNIDNLRVHQTEGIHRSMSWLCCFLPGLPMSFTVENIYQHARLRPIEESTYVAITQCGLRDNVRFHSALRQLYV